MTHSFQKDIIFWLIVFGFILLIFGMNLTKFTPIDLKDKVQTIINPNDVQLKLETSLEKFSNRSSQDDIGAGASTLYDFDVSENKTEFSIETPSFSLPDMNWSSSTPSSSSSGSSSSGSSSSGSSSSGSYTPTPSTKSELEKDKKNKQCEEEKKYNKEVCRECDITQNKDINKYVLKSSVPPCPDVSNYASKNMIPPDFDTRDWIRKSEIQPCEKVDLSNYIHKNQVPSCPPPVTCPECPICPKNEPAAKCKLIQEFSISEHPDLKNYVKKSDLINSKEVQEYIKNNYIPKQSSPSTLDMLSGMSPSKQSSPNTQYQYKNPYERLEDAKSPFRLYQKQWQKDADQSPIFKDAMYVGDSLYASVN